MELGTNSRTERSNRLLKRKFCRTILPQLKYHNPSVSMTVDRLQEPSCPASITVYYKTSPDSAPNAAKFVTTSSQQTSTPNYQNKLEPPSTAKHEISMKGKSPEIILGRFMKITNSIPVQISDEDLELKQWLEKASEKSLKEAKIMKAHNEKRKRQEEMMSAARGVTT